MNPSLVAHNPGGTQGISKKVKEKGTHLSSDMEFLTSWFGPVTFIRVSHKELISLFLDLCKVLQDAVQSDQNTNSLHILEGNAQIQYDEFAF